MSMVTQCPKCRTAFNVTPEQLFARDGRVRCGHCKSAFDGLVHLTSLEALKAGTPPPLAEGAKAAAQLALTAGVPPVNEGPGFSPLNWPMLPDVPVVPPPPLPLERAVEGVKTLADVVSEPRLPTSREMPSETSPDNSPRDYAGDDFGRPTAWHANAHPARSRLWRAAAVLAALLLPAQVFYAYRSEAAAQFPNLRPPLEHACALLGCSVPLLQRASAITISASDMLIIDEAQPNLVQLIVTLQNQSSLEVGYPAIDLALNDRYNHVVARRVLLPRQYLKGGNARGAMLAPGVATTVRVDLDLNGLSAGGFSLLLAAAPDG